MSISVHFSPGIFKNLQGGLQKHQERFTSAEASKVKRTTLSYIDQNETKNNVLFYQNSELREYGNSVKKKLAHDIQALDNELRKQGKRAKRSNANTWMAGTFQIGKDSLAELGYEHGLPWSKQSDEARERVKRVYQTMVKGAIDNRDNYGILQTATLHVDEGIPHVDFISTGVDPEDPEYSLRTVLNGSKKVRKGQKLRMIQEDVESNLRDELGDEVVDMYHLWKGDGSKNNSDEKAYLIEKERELKELEDEVKQKERDYQNRLNEHARWIRQRIDDYYNYRSQSYHRFDDDDERILQYLNDPWNIDVKQDMLGQAEEWEKQAVKKQTSDLENELNEFIRSYKAQNEPNAEKGDDSPQFD